MDNSKKKVFTFFVYLIIAVILLSAIALIWPVHKAHERMKNNVQALNEDLAMKSAECAKLNKSVHDLDSDPKTVEKVAREKFGLCKDGELIMKYEKPKDKQ